MWCLLSSIVLLGSFIAGCFYFSVWIDSRGKIMTKDEIKDMDNMYRMDAIYH